MSQHEGNVALMAQMDLMGPVNTTVMHSVERIITLYPDTHISSGDSGDDGGSGLGWDRNATAEESEGAVDVGPDAIVPFNWAPAAALSVDDYSFPEAQVVVSNPAVPLPCITTTLASPDMLTHAV
jgi:hypothetical protein